MSIAAHKLLSEITADEAMILIGNFAHRVKQADAAARREEVKIGTELGRLREDSVEYALAVCALASQNFESQKAQFSELVRLLNKIRPPTTGGRMASKNIPETFGGMWPHQRLGHRNWTSFVTTPRSGERDPSDPTKYRRPPGLGWSKQYESNIAAGFKQIEELVRRAMPEASPEEHAKRVDEVTEGAGVELTKLFGEKEVTSPGNFNQGEAACVTESLAAGKVTASDVRERGPEALKNPRPKRQRSEATVDSVVKTVRRWNPEAIRELIARLEEVLAA